MAKQMKTYRKGLVFLIVWLIAYILTLQFYRFKFGLFEISIFFVTTGILIAMRLPDRGMKNQNNDITGKR
jgi:hypothetical protein